MTAAQGAVARGVPFGGALGRAPGDTVGRGAENALDRAGSRGRTRVTSKAITRVATALGAEALDVAIRSVSVRLSDDNGMLAVTVSGPIRVSALNDLVDAAVVSPGETILERCERAQSHIREVTSALTGASISRVTVHLTGIETTQKERVK
ncbi:hypothetical protein [Subtercola endophyticus]|uniref:hypothetical protein n=1 Tax=Subtercola endophyticus TaxID=2895559 RepID=UPI001E4320C6|nr:hypothetical protein [Subtercola endophyticus]UFS58266.1 hypothetical protein LQ955_14765 [Subtercola endophyticus]